MTVMQAYKFDTRISETGIISLPFETQLFNKEVEIIVLPKEKEHKPFAKGNAAMDFIQKWTGAFKIDNDDCEQARYDYLMEKYK
jgi:hypothetical protein